MVKDLIYSICFYLSESLLKGNCTLKTIFCGRQTYILFRLPLETLPDLYSTLPSPFHSSFNPSSQGEEARNTPGESVTEEQFTDEDGNLVTRKVTILILIHHLFTRQLTYTHTNTNRSVSTEAPRGKCILCFSFTVSKTRVGKQSYL